MAKLETQTVFDGSIEKTFAAIRQYSKYPEYLPGVTSIVVLPPKQAKSSCQVRYDLKIIKDFYYILNMYETEPKKIWWDLGESNLMKESTGSWSLVASGANKTKATYSLNIKLKGLIPSAITDRVAEANIPAMMAGFQKMINES